MHEGRMVFSQLIDHAPIHEFRRCVARYGADYRLRSFSCWDQFLCMAFAQLTFRESLRDIEACLRAAPTRLYHLGVRGNVSRSTLADANERRDWRVYADFAQSLISVARKLYAHDSFGVELEETVYALDSTTIDLCLSLCPWAPFKDGRGAVKLHTLLDLRGSIPSLVRITHGRISDMSTLDEISYEPGAFYILDRAYLDFKRLWRIQQCGAFFVTRSWKNTQFARIASRPVDESTGLRCDQTIRFSGVFSRTDYPSAARRVRYRDPDTAKKLVFLTNHFGLAPITIAHLYRSRWRVEIFFKWIKQHLRIKAFYGYSENAIKTQIWIAVATYLLVAIARKRLQLEVSLHSFLQVLSVSLFEKTPIIQAFEKSTLTNQPATTGNQLSLLDF
ncbi:MAG TPA: IS4 family transposase [Candidatus Methylomirabilis sp.]|nr:IS4 family transposase [Candidatus Methylomirabilis sp.]